MGGFEPVFGRDSGPQNDATGFFGVWILDGQLLSKKRWLNICARV